VKRGNDVTKKQEYDAIRAIREWPNKWCYMISGEIIHPNRMLNEIKDETEFGKRIVFFHASGLEPFELLRGQGGEPK